jgi:hypothetical protein
MAVQIETLDHPVQSLKAQAVALQAAMREGDGGCRRDEAGFQVTKAAAADPTVAMPTVRLGRVGEERALDPALAAASSGMAGAAMASSNASRPRKCWSRSLTE